VLGGRLGARDATAVVRFLMEWARGRGRVVAVFDGAEREQLATRYGALEIAWSGAGRAADEEIVRRAGAGGRDWIVVTDDRQLASRCRAAGARVEPVSALMARIEGPRGRRRDGSREASEKPEPSAAEVAHWREVFGDREPGD